MSDINGSATPTPSDPAHIKWPYIARELRARNYTQDQIDDIDEAEAWRIIRDTAPRRGHKPDAGAKPPPSAHEQFHQRAAEEAFDKDGASGVLVPKLPTRDPRLVQIMDRTRRTLHAISADNPDAKLNAVQIAARDLERIGDDGSDSIGEISNIAIHGHGMDVDAVQDALARGAAVAWEERNEARANGDPGLDQSSKESPPQLVMTLPDFLAGYVQPEYVVDGILKRGFLYALTAMTGAGKTAIALLIAEIASNRKRRRMLGPHEVAHVRAVYIACENADDVRERLIGMEAKMDFKRGDLDMLVIDQVFDLEKNLDRICKEVDEFGGNVGWCSSTPRPPCSRATTTTAIRKCSPTPNRSASCAGCRGDRACCHWCTPSSTLIARKSCFRVAAAPTSTRSTATLPPGRTAIV
jgi:hypothetical protein